MRRYVNLLFKRLISYFPTPLPVGMAEFKVWALSIREIAGSGLENVPQDQFEWVLSSAIQHADKVSSSVPKQYFVRIIRKGAANQVAAQVFHEVKTRQLEAEQAAKEAAAKQAEASTQEVSNGATQN